jgi:DNA-binding PadR family transcriptional regulator
LNLPQWNVNGDRARARETAHGEAITTTHQLNATAASLLGFLHDGPLTGWDLVQTAQREIGDFWSLTQSQVYRELAAMAEAGLVEAGERGRRDRRPYSLTEAGRAAFAEWVGREPGPETIRFPLLLTVLFGRHLPAERLAEFLERHRSVHAARLADYERQHRDAVAAGAGDAAPHALATLEFGLAYERAVLDWFDKLPTVIKRDAGGETDDHPPTGRRRGRSAPDPAPPGRFGPDPAPRWTPGAEPSAGGRPR